MPTRIIREGIITSESVNSLSTEAELFYRRLMSVADDYGRYYSHPSILRAACYPLQLDKVSEKLVKQMLSECISAGLMDIYGEGKYVFIVKFGQQTRSKSKFPEPIENELLINCKSNDKKMLSLVGDVFVDGVEGGDGKSASNEAFSLPFDSSAFKDAWKLWIKHRIEIKKKLTPTCIQEQFNEFKDMGESRAVAAIKHTIAKGWQGIREPDQNKKNTVLTTITKDQHANGF